MIRILILFVLFTLYSEGQDLNINLKKDKVMEYFDVNKYKDWEIDPDYYPITGAKFFKKGAERVSIHFSNENIIEVKSNYQSPIKTKNIYYSSNKLLYFLHQILEVLILDNIIKIIDLAGGILATTSANISGEATPKSYDELSEAIKSKVDILIDSGECKLGEASTIIDLTSDVPKILRKGAISIEEIEKIIGRVG